MVPELRGLLSAAKWQGWVALGGEGVAEVEPRHETIG
jgi:hypothetical protein